MKKGIIIVLVIIILVALYLLINPLLIKPISVYYPRYLANIDDAKNYYSLLSAFFSVIVGLFGLTLGCFYYFNKKQTDKDVSEKDKKHKRIEALINELNTYNNYVLTVLCSNINNTNELTLLRAKLISCFDNIESMLQQNYTLYNLNEEDTKVILKVNSYIDKNPIIIHSTFEQLKSIKSDELNKVKDDYYSLIKEARRVCYSKIS